MLSVSGLELSEGLWARRLARALGEPLSCVYLSVVHGHGRNERHAEFLPSNDTPPVSYSNGAEIREGRGVGTACGRYDLARWDSHLRSHAPRNTCQATAASAAFWW